MRKILLFSVVLVFLHCSSPYVERIITHEGAMMELNGAVFDIPENSVQESTLVKIEKKSTSKRTYEQGYNLTGQAFTIIPDTLVFEKPIHFSMPMTKQNMALGAKIGNGFVPLANSIVENETLRAQLWHGGEYYVIEKPLEYGIKDHSDVDNALLLVTDPYVSDYVKKFKYVLRQNEYEYPVWTYVYDMDKSIEDNSYYLADELKKLHEQYGKFRLDIVSFGIGGLVAHRYMVDTLLYHKDISSAVIAVGTPFLGSNFAIIDSAKAGASPYRFFYVDGLDDNVVELISGSDALLWTHERGNLPGGYGEPEESKNFASIRGRISYAGDLPEETDGDGLVSLSSTMLTAIEPEPFSLGHFELFENAGVHGIIQDFVQLYNTFAWLDFFRKVWQGEEPFSKINAIWEKEARLHYRNAINFDVLVEYNENMLKSVPANSILITNGDNDTYPSWFLQGMGVRKDIIILNRSLANLKEYLKFLIKQGLPLEMTDGQLETLKHDYDKKTGKAKTISDKVINMLLEQNKRPVVFATTVYSPEQYGYPLRLSGLVYEISDKEVVDIDKTRELLYNEFSYEKFFSVELASLSKPIQSLANNYAGIAHELSIALSDLQMYDEALEANDYAKRFVKSGSYYFLSYNDAKIYLKLGMKDKADSAFKAVLNNAGVDLSVKKDIAEYYYGMDMKTRAIQVLAECLKEEPGNEEILELIKKYQEGL